MKATTSLATVVLTLGIGSLAQATPIEALEQDQAVTTHRATVAPESKAADDVAPVDAHALPHYRGQEAHPNRPAPETHTNTPPAPKVEPPAPKVNPPPPVVVPPIIVVPPPVQHQPLSPPVSVSEPATFGLLGAGVIAAVLLRRRQKRSV